jgi:hypothetical protein
MQRPPSKKNKTVKSPPKKKNKEVEPLTVIKTNILIDNADGDGKHSKFIDEMSKEEIITENKKLRGKKGKHYVSPKEFETEILTFYETNVITDILGKNIYDIATKLGFAGNFINYSYKEDMVGDAIIKMFKALQNKKYDPKKCRNGNSFSYFTKIAVNAFRNRIKKEKRGHEAITNYQESVYDSLEEAGLINITNDHSSGTSEEQYSYDK